MDRKTKAQMEYSEMVIHRLLPAGHGPRRLNAVVHTRNYVVEHRGKSHTVDLDKQSCTCPDHKTRQIKCKHIWRVELETGDIETVSQHDESEHSSTSKSKKRDWRPGNFTWF